MECIQWFPFHSIMLHAENYINRPEENLQLFLKALLMFKIMIWYDETIVHEDALDAVGIMYINCGNTIGCLLDNQPIKYLITPFEKMVFQHAGLSWIIQSNQELNFNFQHHCISWITNFPY